jgi:hypothetical protein
MPLFSENLKWLSSECILPHYFNKPDKKLSEVFPSICISCLLNKLGVIESVHLGTNISLMCNNWMLKYQTIKSKINYEEGPFLKASGTNSSNLAFDENVLIFPCGNIIQDLLSANVFSLHFTEAIPKIIAKDKSEYYVLNPFLYRYFNKLFKQKETQDVDKSKLNSTTENSTLKLLSPYLNKTNSLLDAVYETDCCILSSLIQPTWRLSIFFEDHKSIILNKDKGIYFTSEEIHAGGKDFTILNFDISDSNSSKISDQKYNDVADLYCIVNKFLNPMFNNIQLNTEYFKVTLDENDNNDMFIHLRLFCVPHLITSDNEIIRKVTPNVKLIPNLGLVSSAKIFEGDFFVVDTDMTLSTYYTLKMRQRETNVTENKPPQISKNIERECKNITDLY